MISRLKHMNIIKYLNYEIKDNNFNIHMEYMSKGNLTNSITDS